MNTRLLAASLAMGLVASGCTGGNSSGGPAKILESSGEIEVHSTEGWQPAGDEIAADARIRISGEGAYVLLESDLGRVRVAPAEGAEIAEVTFVVGAIDLDYGDVLVSLAEDRSVTLRSTGPDLSVVSDAGTVRLTEGAYTMVASYAGSANAVLIEQELFVPPWHEASLRAGRLPADATPIRLFTDDAFDRFAASDVLALDGELLALRRGYQAEFGSRIESIDELDPIARDAARDPFTFVRPVMQEWKSGDVLIGVVIALLLEANGEGPLPEMFDKVRNLYSRGATWGVTAAIFGYAPDTLVDRVGRAIALRSGAVEPGRGDPINEPPPREEPPFPRPTSSPVPQPSPSSSPTPTRSPTPTSSPSPSPSPTPTQSPSPTPTNTDPTPPTPPPTPSISQPIPSQSCEPVDQIFGNC
jgi:hypothetical protein